jgi:hypothetical protein
MSRKSRRLSRLQSSTSQTWIGFDIGQLSKQILSYLHTLNKTCTPTLETSHGKWESSNQGKFFNHLSTVSFFSTHLDFLIEAQMFDYYAITQSQCTFSIVNDSEKMSHKNCDSDFQSSFICVIGRICTTMTLSSRAKKGNRSINESQHGHPTIPSLIISRLSLSLCVCVYTSLGPHLFHIHIHRALSLYKTSFTECWLFFRPFVIQHPVMMTCYLTNLIQRRTPLNSP